MNRKKIVILGAGFGGIYTARNLAKKLDSSQVEIIVIDQRNYFLFTPLLHEVAAATIDDKVPVESISSLLKSKILSWKVGKVLEIDTKSKQVICDRFKVDYDFLIVALGSTTNTYGVAGVEEHCLDLKSIGDAISIKHRLISNFEMAVNETDAIVRKKLLTISIIGAGPTGLELAGEISDFVNDVLKHFFKTIKRSEVVLNIFNASDAILPNFNSKLGVWASGYLEKSGWKLHKNSKVLSVLQDQICLEGSKVDSGVIIWTAGVKPNAVLSNFELDKGSRIVVDKFLQVKDTENIYALGDIASAGPMLAQVAVQQAKIVSLNIQNKLIGRKQSEFVFNDKGFLLSLGKWNGIGQVFGFPIKGWWVWIMWHAVYFFKFVSIPKKIIVLLDWIMHVFRTRDISSY